MAVVRGTNGGDRLSGTRRSDELLGFDGDDVLIGGRGADVLEGGLGVDAASYQTAGRRVVADLLDTARNTGDAKGDSYRGVERLIGTNFGDELRGGAGDTALFGRGGDDTLVGQAGATRLVGGDGADRLVGFGVTTVAAYWESSRGVVADLARSNRNTGEAAGDTYENIIGLEGSNRGDRLHGDSRDNILSGLGGDDELYGGSGADRLRGGRGGDELFGGRGVDAVLYDSAAGSVKVDLVRAQANRGDAAGDVFTDVESVEGSRFGDRLYGDAVANRLSGGEGNDRLNGRAGKDMMFGDAGDDRLSGGADDDTLMGGAGADRLVGSSGVDVAVYWSASFALTVDLQNAARNTGEARGDVFSGIEGLAGSSFSDILRGTEASNRLIGRQGDDRLDGRGGADVLQGEAGDDTLLGRGGDDVMYGGADSDRMYGGGGVDTASYLFAATGVVAHLRRSTDAGAGEAAGDRYSSVENLVGSGHDDVLTGSAGSNRIAAGAGADVITGGSGGDRLLGDLGDDVISGGAGNDALNGGLGRDVLTGGSGADVFVFNTALATASSDEVADFQVGTDRFELGRFIFGGQPLGTLDADRFVVGAAAADGDDRIVYDTATGFLSFDRDGSGSSAAVRFAVVTPGLDLGAADFTFI